MFSKKRLILKLDKITTRLLSGVKRKYPVYPEQTKDLPVFQYPVSKATYKRVFVWGSSQTGALGVPFYKKRLSNYVAVFKTPKRLGFAEKHQLTHVACGYGFTAYAVKSKDNVKLYGTGLNCDGQLGHHEIRKGHPLENIFFPQPISLPFKEPKSTKIVKLSAGRAHLLALTDEGLFLLGNNSYGQCGRTIVPDEDHTKSSYINYIPKLDKKNIIDVVCGQDHSLAITSDGSVYSCGCGTDGQTGLGHYEVESHFIKVKGDIESEKIVKVASKGDFVLALNDKGDVFGWGNNEYSQLDMVGRCSQQQCVPVHIKPLTKFGRIKDIAAGGTSCMVLTENGDVFVWGYGLLGVGPRVECSANPLQIPGTLFGQNVFHPDNQVVALNCGLSHSTAITSSGDLYTWGRNKNCCLGLGSDKDQFFPLKVALGGIVRDVSCGVDHMVAICKPFV